jgi:S-adenosylmethionine hydrolase
MLLPLITLTTDFGYASPYVGVMKGVIHSLVPQVHVVDLSHAIQPQNVRQAAYLLATAVPYFPSDTIHVCVVDPGVGTARAALYTQVNGQHLLGPDNGLFTLLWRRAQPQSVVVRRLTQPCFWRPTVSSTFHGRDIFAPVAAHLARGIDPSELGPLHPEPQLLAIHEAGSDGQACWGEIQFIDDFGNLITNIPASMALPRSATVQLGERVTQFLPWVRTYAEATPNTLVILLSSDGFVEIAEVQGNAAQRLQVSIGETVRLSWLGDNG